MLAAFTPIHVHFSPLRYVPPSKPTAPNLLIFPTSGTGNRCSASAALG
jgi:hypothetical protein